MNDSDNDSPTTINFHRLSIRACGCNNYVLANVNVSVGLFARLSNVYY